MQSIIAHLHELMSRQHGATDIQIEERLPVMCRTPTGWQDSGFGTVTQADMLPLLNHVSREWKSNLHEGRSINRTFTLGDLRLRACMYLTQSRERVAMTLRLLPAQPPRLEELGLPVQVMQFTALNPGILLVAGATGVGKTTTIAALIERINETRPVHVVTIEDPIEVTYKRKQAIITQREVGRDADVVSFAQGVREAMRQCPDVIVIGEVRDTETAEAALQAAESGHYVIASLHAKSAIGATVKMMSFFPDDQRIARITALASTLRGVIYQTMMPTLDKQRSVVAAEVLSGNSNEIANSILSGEKLRTLEERLEYGQLPGCVPLSQSIKHLVEKGLIAQTELVRNT